jgi:hypothetical protein
MPIFKVQAPDGSVIKVEAPEGASQEAVISFAASQHQTPTAPIPDPQELTMGSQFKTGLKESSAQLGALLTEGLPAQLQALIGDEEGSKKNFEEYMAKTDKISQKFPSLDKLDPDGNALKKFALYSARTAGSTIPSLGASIVGGGAALAASGGNPIAAGGGFLATSMAMNSPESFVNLMENSDIQDPQKAAQVAVGVGAVKSALDFAPVGHLFGKTFGEIGKLAATKALFTKAGMKQAASVVGKQMGETAAAEGVTEAMQEALDIEATRLYSHAPEAFFAKENILKMAHAGYAGMLGGGLSGGVGGAIQVGRSYDPKMPKFTRDEEELKDILSEEISDPEVTPAQSPINDPAEARTILGDLGYPVNYITSLSDPDAIKGANIEISKPLKPAAVPNVTQAIESMGQIAAETTGSFSVAKLPATPQTVKPPKTPKISKGSSVKYKGVEYNVKKINKDGTLFLQHPTDPRIIRAGMRPNAVEVVATQEPLQGVNTEAQTAFVFNIPETHPKTHPKTPKTTKGVSKPVQTEIPNIPLNNVILESVITPDDLNAVKEVLQQPTRRKRQKVLTQELFDAQTELAPPEKMPKAKTPAKPFKRGDTVYVGPDAYTVAWFDPTTNKIHAKGTGKNKVTMAFPADFASLTPKLQRLGWVNRDILSSPIFRGGELWDYSEGILRGLEVKVKTPELSAIEKIVAKMTGGTAVTRFFTELRAFNESKSSDPIRGAQIGNTVAVALNLNEDIVETALHETWHLLYDERLGMFTEKERITIEKNIPNVISALERNYGVSAKDLLDGYSSEEGRAELLATLFGLYAKDRLRGTQEVSTPTEIKGFFQRALNFIKALKKAFNQNGYSKVTDIFDKVIEGEAAPVQDSLNDLTYQMRVARLQNLGDTVRKNAKEISDNQSWEQIAEEFLSENTGDLAKLSFYTKYMSTAKGQASNEAFMALAVGVTTDRDALQAELQTDFSEGLQDFLREKDSRVKDAAANILDELRLTEQRVRLDEQGRLTFKRGDKTVTLKPYFSKLIQTLDNGMKQPLRVWEAQARELLKTYMPDSFNKTADTIKKHFEEGKYSFDEKTEEKVRPLVEAVVAFKKMLDKAYIHHGRMGPFAYTVHLKSSYENGKLKTDAVPVFHAHFEEGKHLGKVNKFQYETSMKELDAELLKQGLTEKDVTRSGVYEATYNNMFNQLQNSVNTVDLLNSLLGGVDPTQAAKLRDELTAQIKTKGFMRVIKETKEIPGYSKDWNRVISNFITSSSIHLSNQKYQPRFEFLKTQMEKRLGNSAESAFIKNNALKYIDYVNSGVNDFARFTTFNYMMTMALNFSSAALQVAGLPTFTVAALTQYHPNFITNQAKVMGLFSKITGTAFMSSLRKTGIDQFDKGSLLLRFDTKEFHNELKLTEGASAYASHLYRTGLSGGLLVEEALNKKAKDTRTAAGTAEEYSTILKNASGMMMSVMEQITRMTTALAVYQTFEENPSALRKAEELLAGNLDFQASRKANPEIPLIQAVTDFTIREVHGEFGKTGRGPLYRGLGRVFMPFSQYPATINEFMMNLYLKRGAEGRQAFAYLLGSLVLIGGLMAVPAAEAIKEMLELLIKLAKQQDVDLEHEFRVALQKMTGSDTLGVGLAQGLPRVLGLSISSRVRPQIPGQDLAFALTGAKGGDLMGHLGVGGSAISNALLAVQEFREGGQLPLVLAGLTPTAISNILKATTIQKEGIMTRDGSTMLVPAEEVTNWMQTARMLGFTTSKEATEREKQYFAKLEEGRFKPIMNTYRAAGKNHLSRLIRANKQGNLEEAAKHRKKVLELTKELAEFLKKEKLPPEMLGSFQETIFSAQPQLLKGGIDYKKVDNANKAKVRKQEQAMSN